MKNFKLFVIIIALLTYQANSYASGRATKLISPITKTALGTTSFLTSNTAYAEESHPYIEKNQTNGNNYTVIAPVKAYEQAQAFKAKSSVSTIPTTKFADLSSQHFTNSTTGKSTTITIDPSIFNDITAPEETVEPAIQSNNELNNSSLPVNKSAQQPLSLSPNLGYQKSTQGRFGFKGIPDSFSKKTQQPKTDQLLLTYDPSFEKNNSPISQTEELQQTSAQALSSSENKQPIESKLETFKAPEPQEEHQTFDIDQIDINDKITLVSPVIDSWIHEYKDTTSNMYSQANLEDDIAKALFVKNEKNGFVSTDLKVDTKVLEILLDRYKTNPDVQNVLHNVAATIKQQITSEKVSPKQANTAVSRYYTRAMRDDIFALTKTHPIFDATGNVTNMPSIETIIKTATENPTAQSFKALQTSLEAVKVAIYACRSNSSIFGDGNLLIQLKSFEKEITTATKNPRFTQFQSWGSYIGQTVSDAGAAAFDATLGKVSVRTALTAGQQAINQITPYVNTLADMSGVKNMTLNRVAQTTGLLPQETKVAPVDPNAPPKQLTSFQQNIKESNEKNDTQQIRVANNAIAQYYTPAMLNDIFMLIQTKPEIDPATGMIQNMPSVENMLEVALKNPSQGSFNALQAMLEATKVAKYAHRNESSFLNPWSTSKQLTTYETQISKALQQPQFTQFHTWTTRATTYAASFIPSVKTVLDTTGLGDMTVGSALNNLQTARYTGQAALAATGLDSTVDATKYLTNAAVHASGVLDMNLSQAIGALSKKTA